MPATRTRPMSSPSEKLLKDFDVLRLANESPFKHLSCVFQRCQASLRKFAALVLKEMESAFRVKEK